ncbi:hypothetical protein FOMPIDRAFT_1018108 [Fomitopsis schrenkii]|uniref:Homeobox domain-containing protein n=1 Tax=Fomitopsis schrenkii TaxID=2126942 RepID=S8F867_FOMSC|nr:hypothetical protein FOMPIDRAFT_1018108 [Fomitopsis schrenkii]
MLTAVSSWEPHPAYLAAQDTSSPASSCYSSPTQSIYGRTNDELEAAEALLILSRSAPARQYYYHPYQAGPLYQYPGPSYSQAGISYQLVGPAQPGIQTPPVQSYERAWAAPTCASVEEQPVAGPSVLRGSGASSPRLVPKARSTSPAPEEVRTPSPRVKRSRSPTPASTTTKPHSTASSIGPQRTAKSRGKARASPVAAAPKETKSGKRKTKAKSEPKEPVMYNADDPRPYYIDRAEWIGLDLETGKPMPGVPPLKSPATEYQAHILAWIFENVTPQPDKFWKAVVATKLSINSAKVHHWFTNQRQRVSKERKATKSATTDALDEVRVNDRKIKMRRQAVEDGEQWTDGRFVGVVDMLIAERQRVFEEEVAAHLAKIQGDAVKPEVDAASDAESEGIEA